MSGLATPGKGKVVTPSDANELQGRGTLYIGTAGDLKVVLADDDTDTAITFKNVAVGDFPRRVKKVFATGTSAADIIQDA